MPKSVIDASMDAGLGYISGNANQIHVCSAQPTTRTEAVTTFNLASGAVAGGDFTLANGDVSGRKQTTAAKSGLSITASGTATHIAITSATELLLVTEVSPTQALTSGGTVDTAAFDHEVGDPT